MIPVLAIVGRPNVGKSTLFNCLTKTKNSIVSDIAGVTRDRQYGEAVHQDNKYIVIDAAGIEARPTDPFQKLIKEQSLQAICEADSILFLVDAKEGLMPDDHKIAELIRRYNKPVTVAVNKTESANGALAINDFYNLGFEYIFPIASAHNKGVAQLMTHVLSEIPIAHSLAVAEEGAIKITVIGRPNVGKSTLINKILGEERLLVFDEPGTTRDSIYIPFERKDISYVLIDTAGVRRRTKVTETIEKFSVIKSLQTIDFANVVIFVLNAYEGVSDQDLRLLDFVVEAGKALVIIVNKWDLLTQADRDRLKLEFERRLDFVTFAKTHFISALRGAGVAEIFKSILQAFQCATKKIPTPILTRILQDAVKQHQPPLVHHRRIKLRYAHPGGHNPPIIVIHGNQAEQLPLDYRRYLINFYRKRLRLVGTPIKIELKSSSNPFTGRKNLLTPRQKAKKTRLLRHVKKNKK